MNVPFAIAGALSLMAAAIHGGVGERLVVTKLRTEVLAPSRFGGPGMTKLMIRVTWHIATLAFLVIGSAMVACTPAGSSQSCRAVGHLAAISFGSFAVLAIGLAVAAQRARTPRTLLRHPGPLAFVAVACLAWWGSS
ncbi:MAG: hypothetical protein ACRDKG_05465 [Actinomycetota bacterium]